MKLNGLTQSPHFKKVIIVGFFSLSLLAWLIYLIYNHYFLTTDNAYIGANIVQIAPRVTGQVSELAIKNNQHVEQGQLLFKIDEEPFRLALNAALADVEIATAQLEHAKQTQGRTLALASKKFSSQQEADNAVASYRTAQANLLRANAALDQAKLNLRYTHVTAPISGWVTNVSLRQGDAAAAYQPVFALISDESFWADTNFKETELEKIRPGQLAEIVVDMYPKHKFKGVVESISGGAGAAFSLLPPQNATGNWVKVTQRVPVRINVLNPDPNFPLRVGTSATVTVSLQRYAKK